MCFLYYVKLLAAKCQLEYTSLIIFHIRENVHLCKQTINRLGAKYQQLLSQQMINSSANDNDSMGAGHFKVKMECQVNWRVDNKRTKNYNSHVHSTANTNGCHQNLSE